MPRYRHTQGRFIKNPAQIEIGSSNTPVTGNPIIGELAEKQRTGQRLTLIERKTLLAWEAKQKQFSTSGKQKEKWKQPVFPSINPPIFQQLEIPLEIEINQTMAEEGHGSVHLTPEQQKAEYERQQREWRRHREQEAKWENDRKGEEDRKRQEDGGD